MQGDSGGGSGDLGGGAGGGTCGGPTLQVDLVLGAVHQDGAHRVQTVIVTASQRPGPRLRYLGNPTLS